MNLIEIIDKEIKDEVEAVEVYSKDLPNYDIADRDVICRIIEDENRHIEILKNIRDRKLHEAERAERKRLFGEI